LALTPRQERFVAEYLIDLNATKAAIRAGYSAKTAEQGGAQLLRNIKVSAAIAGGIAKRAGKLEITAEKVLRDLEEVRVLAIKDGAYGPAAKAIELHGKHIGMFVERTENNTNLVVRDAVDRPERETREQWIARRSKELGIDPRLMGAAAGAAD
jgi:phage terminase small subunit